MDHMPYEDTGMSASPEPEPKREAPVEDPGRTPQSAEGPEKEERKVPAGEPGKTPGSAEGEDPDEFPNAPRY
ncbi:MAG: hypothetical protein ACJ8AT_06295 [Hyalangium sp.]|uniref:hypothetical protein n=1 Tax=Hyalangium sp. TaxID=2028555 RepID=UPI00389981E3